MTETVNPKNNQATSAPENSIDEEWQQWLNADPDEHSQVSTSFQITPISSVENPEEHETKVPLTRNPLFVYGATGTVFALVLFGGYSIFGFVSSLGKRQQVAVAPQVNQGQLFGEEKAIGPDAADLQFDTMKNRRDNDMAVPTATPKPDMKKASKGQTPRIVVQRVPVIQRVVVRDPQRTQSAPAPIPKVMAQPIEQPVAPPEPPLDPEQAWKESGENLYAPDAGEGPAVEPDNIPVADLSTETTNPQPTASSFPTSPTQPVANSTIDSAIAVYDGRPTQTSPVLNQPVAEVPSGGSDAVSVKGDTSQTVAMAEDSTSEPIVTPLEEQKTIPAESSIKAKLLTALQWDAQTTGPMGKELKLKVDSDFKKDGKVIVPKGAIASAVVTESSGGMVQAEVSSIEIPGGSVVSIPSGMMKVETSNGFLQAKLKTPGQKSALTGFVARLGERAAYSVVGSVLPQGDGLGDQIAYDVANEGLNTMSTAINQGQQAQYNIPPLWMIKPKSVDLVSYGDIPLQ
jgi:hypothetical protein